MPRKGQAPEEIVTEPCRTRGDTISDSGQRASVRDPQKTPIRRASQDLVRPSGRVWSLTRPRAAEVRLPLVAARIRGSGRSGANTQENATSSPSEKPNARALHRETAWFRRRSVRPTDQGLDPISLHPVGVPTSSQFPAFELGLSLGGQVQPHLPGNNRLAHQERRLDRAGRQLLW